MIKIDRELLNTLGLETLPELEVNPFLKHVYETLEMRVGLRLSDQMTNQQLDEFEAFYESKDDSGALSWLERNFPDYKEMVQQEFATLQDEISGAASEILAASGAMTHDGLA